MVLRREPEEKEKKKRDRDETLQTPTELAIYLSRTNPMLLFNKGDSFEREKKGTGCTAKV